MSLYEKKQAKLIAQIEQEFGMSIVELLKDYARHHSFSFACDSIGVSPYYLKKYQSIFVPRKHGFSKRPHISKRNYDNAPRYCGLTVSQLAEKSGASKNTIRNRIKLGLSCEQLIQPPKKRGNVNNFNGKRDNSTWKKIIETECANAKQLKTVIE